MVYVLSNSIRFLNKFRQPIVSGNNLETKTQYYVQCDVRPDWYDGCTSGLGCRNDTNITLYIKPTYVNEWSAHSTYACKANVCYTSAGGTVTLGPVVFEVEGLYDAACVDAADISSNWEYDKTNRIAIVKNIAVIEPEIPVEKICDPGERVCENGYYKVCDVTGTMWEDTSEQCESPNGDIFGTFQQYLPYIAIGGVALVGAFVLMGGESEKSRGSSTAKIKKMLEGERGKLEAEYKKREEEYSKKMSELEKEQEKAERKREFDELKREIAYGGAFDYPPIQRTRRKPRYFDDDLW